MIYIGLTGWGDHDTLYTTGVAARNKLQEYAAHFKTVEVDSFFYAIQPKENVEKWIKETPNSFQFVVKAYKEMTLHTRHEPSKYTSREKLFDEYMMTVTPFLTENKLGMILFQFPPWFACTKENVQYLRFCREKMKDFPVALEFRNQTWFLPQYRERTLTFMKDEKWMHGVCDEPQAGEGSVPIVLEATNPNSTLVRMHGRNVYGWSRANDANWREIRHLYRYNKEELTEWVEYVNILQKHSKDIYVLFNNNSGGDAADNAKQFQQMLGIEYDDLSPRQLGLF